MDKNLSGNIKYPSPIIKKGTLVKNFCKGNKISLLFRDYQNL